MAIHLEPLAPAVAAAAASPGAATRLTAIDGVRGIVMVLMALDHVRDFLHRPAMTGALPTDLATTTPLLFLTRWITHLCAPTFMLTAGIGAFLWWSRGRTRAALAAFLLTRGVWLILLELTVMRLAYNFTWPSSYPLLLLVLWALGACMIVLAAAVWLPLRVLAGLSLAVVVLHNAADPIAPADFGAGAWAWHLLHQPGVFVAAGIPIVAGYPVVPWIAVMALGFCLGAAYTRAPAARLRWLERTGAACIAAFALLRMMNGYGDPAPWTAGRSAAWTTLSFLNTTKYPPSLAFLLMTLGPALLLLAWFERHPLSANHPLVRLGRVPLFFFIVHFFAAHVLAVVLALLREGAAAVPSIFHPVPSMGGPRELYPAGFGYELGGVYAAWAAIVLGLYPLCAWFDRVKSAHRDSWLRYL